MLILSLITPYNIFLRKTGVGNVYSTMVICRKFAGLRHMSTSVITITIKTWLSTNITWMMGGRRGGLRDRSTSPVSINTFYNIEQWIEVDLLVSTSVSWTTTPTISSLGWIVSGLRPISNSPITNNSISWWSQKSTTFTLVVVWIVADLRPISTSPFNIKYFSPIARGTVAFLLWPRYTSTNISSVITRWRVIGQRIPTPTTSAITWGIVTGIKRPMYTTLLTQRHVNNFFFINFTTIVMMVGGITAGIPIPIF